MMKRVVVWAAGAALLCGCAAPPPQVAKVDARVTVNADQVGLAVNPAVTRGYNFGNWMAMVDHGEALALTPAASLRFPGGNIGDEQDMDAATLNAFRSLLTLVKGSPETRDPDAGVRRAGGPRAGQPPRRRGLGRAHGPRARAQGAALGDRQRARPLCRHPR
ncbi:hypothetical protein LRS03_10670 [Rhizobacter sp. J219]|uniref:hypothetical protein n=1 Tax=Rhizobacter sp. J219 TaxID=2898430 RepID=UPI002150FCBA|nr:hypothetical protein [Rhizobacter sp. J219]MCR5883291.1 hypothetical protein [Rhizobacter sp. J219]